MKNHETMSDHQLNVAFLKMLRHKGGFTNDKDIVSHPHDADGRSVGVVQNGEYCWYDFCFNPSDSFRFMMHGGVTQIKLQNGLWYAITEFKGEKLPRYSAMSNHPLKAGVMALLKEYEAGEG